ncbi:MAG: IS3 family transposase [Oscillospiraceae bacterium]
MVINELKQKYTITAILQVVDIPRSTYYYYCKQIEKPDKYTEVKAEMKRIWEECSENYGYRRMTKELRNKRCINHKTVSKLMNQMGLFCHVKMYKYKSYKGEVGKIAPNLLERNFIADKPNDKWVSDVTEFKLFGTKLYLSPIIDLFNGEVVSYNLSYHPNFAQITDMLTKAFAKIPNNTNLILHTDQGWQYQMKRYQKMLADKGIRQSMSHKGNCLDNACAESFFGRLKTEMFYDRVFNSVDDFIRKLQSYIEWYNTKRIKSRLGMSPVEFNRLTA